MTVCAGRDGTNGWTTKGWGGEVSWRKERTKSGRLDGYPCAVRARVCSSVERGAAMIYDSRSSKRDENDQTVWTEQRRNECGSGNGVERCIKLCVEWKTKRRRVEWTRMSVWIDGEIKRGDTETETERGWGRGRTTAKGIRFRRTGK